MARKKLTIMCAGGKVLEEPDSLRKFIKHFVTLEGRKIMVHGGGEMALRIAARLGIKPKSQPNGEPVMDEDLLNVYTMVHAGLIETRLTALLQLHGITAVGLTGIDMGLVTATRKARAGAWGKVNKVNTPQLLRLLDEDIIPVIASLVADAKGARLYADEDDVAAEVARVLAPTHEITLVYCTDRNGVLLNEHDPDSVIAVLRRSQYRNLREMEIIKGGMLPKIDSAFSSIDHGVSRVLITGVDNLDRPGHGTLIK